MIHGNIFQFYPLSPDQFTFYVHELTGAMDNTKLCWSWFLSSQNQFGI